MNKKKKIQNQIKNSPILNKQLDCSDQKQKRKYTIKKMPMKLNQINPYFIKFGFTGAEEDEMPEDDFDSYYTDSDDYSNNNDLDGELD